MMLLGSHYSKKPFPAISHSVYSTPVPPHTLSVERSDHSSLSGSSLPTWITQALCDLTLGEQELQRLREHQTNEVDEVNQTLDSAIFAAQKEERRLLEKVEKEHREAQQRLLQLKRENSAAARVGQSLVDQQLRKMNHLKEQIHMWGRYPSGPNKSQLLRGVQELMQPWEISLSLKKVFFQPSPESNIIHFGEIQVQEHSPSFPVGVCGPQGHKCALHTGQLAPENRVTVSEQICSPIKGSEDTDDQKSNSGSRRVVRKIRLSVSGKDKPHSTKPSKLRECKRDRSESSQDEELEMLSSDSHEDDLFLALSPLSNQEHLNWESSESGQNNSKGYKRGQRKHRALMSVSSQEPSCPPEECRPEDCHSGQEFQKGPSSLSTLTGSKSSYSCLDLSFNDQLHDQSLDELRLPTSPTDSLDSSYTFTIRSARSCYNSQPSTSSLDLTDMGSCFINGKEKLRRNLASPTSIRGLKVDGTPKTKPLNDSTESSTRVCRSLSMSDIERKGRRTKTEHNGDGGIKKESNSGPPNVKDGKRSLMVGYLVKKFGKQGSGRTDFTLPSGVHVTPQGQLYVVDCGNVRVQVTDQQRNLVQQVTLAASDGNSRHCRNLFDVAANSKGLIALTCAAERAVLVFNRHARLLQTFGGSGAQQDFEAPRGVTVTMRDEFLVADIRRGTLTTLKLDSKTGSKTERTVVTGFYRPYLVAACLVTGLMAVSERGNETGRSPCIKVLEPGWNTIRVLGVCSGMGPVLTSPWGLCIDADGNVLVADWGKQHQVVFYPPAGVGRAIVTHGLNSPRGLALLPEGHLVVSDSMNHCIKIYRYK